MVRIGRFFLLCALLAAVGTAAADDLRCRQQGDGSRKCTAADGTVWRSSQGTDGSEVWRSSDGRRLKVDTDSAGKTRVREQGRTIERGEVRDDQVRWQRPQQAGSIRERDTSSGTRLNSADGQQRCRTSDEGACRQVPPTIYQTQEIK